MNLKAPVVIALSAVMTIVGYARTPEDARFTSFKHNMLPKVGQQIKVIGSLKIGKFGWWISFGCWGIYIGSRRDVDVPKLNTLNRFSRRKVKARGILRHQKEIIPTGACSDHRRARIFLSGCC